MKKMLKKMGLVALMMALTGNVVFAAIAEEAAPAPAPAAVEAPAPAEEKPSEPAPAPVEEKPAEEKATEEKATEEKATEEKPAEEKAAEEKPTEEKATEEKVAEEKPVEEKVAFTGTVTVKLVNDGQLYYGDTVTLKAVVKGANADYTIRWQLKKPGSDEWKTISGETSKTYSFTVNEDNAEYAYRAVLVVAD